METIVELARHSYGAQLLQVANTPLLLLLFSRAIPLFNDSQQSYQVFLNALLLCLLWLEVRLGG
jgi:hypothetical protein